MTPFYCYFILESWDSSREEDGWIAMDRRRWDAKEERREGLCVCGVFSLFFSWPRPVFFFFFFPCSFLSRRSVVWGRVQ